MIDNRKIESSIILLLLLITVSAIFLQQFSLNHSLVLDAHSPYVAVAVDDRTVDGQSVSKLDKQGDYLILECEIVESDYPWPYCEIDINLTLESKIRGLDLSKFDRVGLELGSDTRAGGGIRFHLRNYNSSYSRPEEYGTYKYNSIEFFHFEPGETIWIPINSFQVATWWLVEHSISIEDMGPEFSNILSLEIATGTNIQPGTYRIVVKKIEFQGKRFQSDTFYLLLVALWGISGIGALARRYLIAGEALKKSTFRQQELEAVNRLLNIKSRRLEDRVSIDTLTGVLNRDGLQKIFYEGLSASSNVDAGLCIVFMDIDNFKSVNDTFGHLVGDSVLREFAKVLMNNTRRSDMIARWGGEEFILVCPNGNLDNVADIAEKLRKSIENHDWPNNILLTCSFGVAKMGNESLSEFIARADVALYTAKTQGRNQVVVAREELSQEEA